VATAEVRVEAAEAAAAAQIASAQGEGERQRRVLAELARAAEIMANDNVVLTQVRQHSFNVPFTTICSLNVL
jgi:hypothetical protein